MTEIFETTLEENLSMIKDSIQFLRKNNKRVFFDAEHFFDGYKKNPEYAMDVISVAAEAGAECVVLCDTNGGAIPSEISSIISMVNLGPKSLSNSISSKYSYSIKSLFLFFFSFCKYCFNFILIPI